MEERINISVYGSLLTKLRNHHVLGRHVSNGDASLVGKDEILGFKLYPVAGMEKRAATEISNFQNDSTRKPVEGKETLTEQLVTPTNNGISKDDELSNALSGGNLHEGPNSVEADVKNLLDQYSVGDNLDTNKLKIGKLKIEGDSLMDKVASLKSRYNDIVGNEFKEESVMEKMASVNIRDAGDYVLEKYASVLGPLSDSMEDDMAEFVNDRNRRVNLELKLIEAGQGELVAGLDKYASEDPEGMEALVEAANEEEEDLGGEEALGDIPPEIIEELVALEEQGVDLDEMAAIVQSLPEEVIQELASGEIAPEAIEQAAAEESGLPVPDANEIIDVLPDGEKEAAIHVCNAFRNQVNYVRHCIQSV